MANPRGHSNVKLEGIRQHEVVSDAIMIPIEGGATLQTVRPLPTLALRRNEWKAIGDRMNWWQSPPDTNGGSLWIEFHDRGGRVELDLLTYDGINEAKFQCARMVEELEEAQEKLDAADSENDEDE